MRDHGLVNDTLSIQSLRETASAGLGAPEYTGQDLMLENGIKSLSCYNFTGQTSESLEFFYSTDPRNHCNAI